MTKLPALKAPARIRGRLPAHELEDVELRAAWLRDKTAAGYTTAQMAKALGLSQKWTELLRRDAKAVSPPRLNINLRDKLWRIGLRIGHVGVELKARATLPQQLKLRDRVIAEGRDSITELLVYDVLEVPPAGPREPTPAEDARRNARRLVSGALTHVLDKMTIEQFEQLTLWAAKSREPSIAAALVSRYLKGL